MGNLLTRMVGIPDDDEDGAPPLEQKSREELISLVERLTEMTAQQARIISSLRKQAEATQPPNGGDMP